MGGRATCTSTSGLHRTTCSCSDDHDLVTEVPISIAQAALGTAIELETLDGTEHLVIPPGTQPGREFVLRQRGVPHLRGRGRGDLRARVRVEIPRSSPTRRSNCSRRYAEGRGEVVGHEKEGLFSRIKSAFH